MRTDFEIKTLKALEDLSSSTDYFEWIQNYDLLYASLSDYYPSPESLINHVEEEDPILKSINDFFRENPGMEEEMKLAKVKLICDIYSKKAADSLKSIQNPINDFIEAYQILEQEG